MSNVTRNFFFSTATAFWKIEMAKKKKIMSKLEFNHLICLLVLFSIFLLLPVCLCLIRIKFWFLSLSLSRCCSIFFSNKQFFFCWSNRFLILESIFCRFIILTTTKAKWFCCKKNRLIELCWLIHTHSTNTHTHTLTESMFHVILCLFVCLFVYFYI